MNLSGKTINPGELRTVVEFDTPTIVTDAGGAQSNTWAKLEDAYVKWTNAHGAELITSEKLGAVRTATVLRRYSASILETGSILKDGARWQIKAVDDIGNRHEYMELVVQLVKGTL